MFVLKSLKYVELNLFSLKLIFLYHAKYSRYENWYKTLRNLVIAKRYSFWKFMIKNAKYKRKTKTSIDKITHCYFSYYR